MATGVQVVGDDREDRSQSMPSDGFVRVRRGAIRRRRSACGGAPPGGFARTMQRLRAPRSDIRHGTRGTIVCLRAAVGLRGIPALRHAADRLRRCERRWKSPPCMPVILSPSEGKEDPGYFYFSSTSISLVYFRWVAACDEIDGRVARCADPGRKRGGGIDFTPAHTLGCRKRERQVPAVRRIQATAARRVQRERGSTWPQRRWS